MLGLQYLKTKQFFILIFSDVPQERAREVIKIAHMNIYRSAASFRATTEQNGTNIRDQPWRQHMYIIEPDF